MLEAVPFVFLIWEQVDDMVTFYQKDWALPLPHACPIWLPTAQLCWSAWLCAWGKSHLSSSQTINEDFGPCADGKNFFKMFLFTNSAASKVHTRHRQKNLLHCTVHIADGATFGTASAKVTARPKRCWCRKRETFLEEKNSLEGKSLCGQLNSTHLNLVLPLLNIGSCHVQLGFMWWRFRVWMHVETELKEISLHIPVAKVDWVALLLNPPELWWAYNTPKLKKYPFICWCFLSTIASTKVKVFSTRFFVGKTVFGCCM